MTRWRKLSELKFPSAKILAGGQPEGALHSVYLFRVTDWRDKLAVLMGARILVRSTVVRKGPGLDMESRSCILRHADKLTDEDIFKKMAANAEDAE